MPDGALFLFVARYLLLAFIGRTLRARGSSGPRTALSASLAGSPTFFPRARRTERSSDPTPTRPRSGRTHTFFARRLPTSTVPSFRPSTSDPFGRRSRALRLPPCSNSDGARARHEKSEARQLSHLASGIGLDPIRRASLRLRPVPLPQAPAVAPSGRLRSDWDGPSTSTRRRARNPKGRSSKRARRSRARGCSKSR